jgi:chromosome segregation ATPase
MASAERLTDTIVDTARELLQVAQQLDSELDKAVTELEKANERIEQLEQANEELAGKLDEQQQENTRLTKQIFDLERQAAQ